MANDLMQRCPSIKFCIAWSTLAHSQVASIFAIALTQALTSSGFFDGLETIEAVREAFYQAKLAVLGLRQTIWISGVGAVAVPLFTLSDPKPGTGVRRESARADGHSKIPVGCVHLLHRSADNSVVHL